MAWAQGPSGLVQMEGSTSAFKGSYLVKGKECGVEVNFDN